MTSLEGWSSTIELRPRGVLRLSHGRRTPSLDGAGQTTTSGRPDLNRGPPAPKAGALPSCATPRCFD